AATPPRQSSTLSLHDALPICLRTGPSAPEASEERGDVEKTEAEPADEEDASQRSCAASVSPKKWKRSSKTSRKTAGCPRTGIHRSEEHTSELQSRFDLVCRLL